MKTRYREPEEEYRCDPCWWKAKCTKCGNTWWSKFDDNSCYMCRKCFETNIEVTRGDKIS